MRTRRVLSALMPLLIMLAAHHALSAELRHKKERAVSSPYQHEHRRRQLTGTSLSELKWPSAAPRSQDPLLHPRRVTVVVTQRSKHHDDGGGAAVAIGLGVGLGVGTY